jgi:GT2 family glycosyltransferase
MTDIINTFVFPIVRNDMILDALESLFENTPQNYKVIVVNQSEWNDLEYNWEYDVWEASDIVIRPSLNYGFAQAANLGTRLATTKYVTIANDDVIFLPDWWDGIERTFERFNETDKPPMVVAPMSPKEPGWGWGVRCRRRSRAGAGAFPATSTTAGTAVAASSTRTGGAIAAKTSRCCWGRFRSTQRG